MIRYKIVLRAAMVAAVLGAGPLWAHTNQPQVLATVGDQSVTSSDLESAIKSSPFAVQFNAMDEDDQAALRGSLLKRLVASRLLLLEARRLDLEHSKAFLSEQATFRNGLLYRSHMEALRAGIVVPDDVKADLMKKFSDNSDARTAAESAYRAEHYREAVVADIKRLRKRYHVRIHEDAIRPDARDQAVLLDADGFKITYADIKAGTDGAKDNAKWMHDRLYKQAQYELVIRAAAERKPDLAAAMTSFRNDRLPAMLLERKVREWIPDEKVLRDYFKAHPGLGKVVELRHIGQLVLATRKQAEAMRKRILAGESLFELAGKYSVDPYGRKHKGDMGWVKVGQGMPAVEKAIANLPDGAVSQVIESPMGFHLVTILGRRPAEQRTFQQVRDRVKQAFIDAHLATYVNGLAQRYPVQWRVLGKRQAARN